MYRMSDVVKVSGLSERQVRYWDDSALITAEVSGADRARWQHRQWSFGDLVLLRAVRRLKEANISTQAVRTVLTYLRHAYPNLGDNLAGVTLAVIGRDVVALAPGEDLPVSTIQRQGQRVLMIEIDNVRREVADAIDQLNAVGW